MNWFNSIDIDIGIGDMIDLHIYIYIYLPENELIHIQFIEYIWNMYRNEGIWKELFSQLNYHIRKVSDRKVDEIEVEWDSLIYLSPG